MKTYKRSVYSILVHNISRKVAEAQAAILEYGRFGTDPLTMRGIRWELNLRADTGFKSSFIVPDLWQRKISFPCKVRQHLIGISLP